MTPQTMSTAPSKEFSAAEQEKLLATLQARFAKHMNRHPGVKWEAVQKRLEASPEKLWSLWQMEETGGEPDVVTFDQKTSGYTFVDCCAETPKDRRSVCYDPAALESRKEHKPKHSAVGMAGEMGVEILTPEQYQYLQTLGEFDTKTSSWLVAPTKVRKLGGAIFGDRRYDTVFIYHNGVESYYAGRGFRGCLTI